MPLMRGNSDIGTLNRFALYTYKGTSEPAHTDTQVTHVRRHARLALVQTEAIYLWGEEDVGKSDVVAHTVVATRTRQQLLNAYTHKGRVVGDRWYLSVGRSVCLYVCECPTSESVCDDLARPVVADLHALIV